MPDTMPSGAMCQGAPAVGALHDIDYSIVPSEPSTSCSCSSPPASDSGSADPEEREARAGGLHKVLHHNVPHCKQHFSWDCGLACVLMVVKATAAHACDYQTLREMCPTTSIWTVDLAHLLRRFGLDVVFFTITLGPNPAYANEGFYMENMQEDERRVSQLFLEAPAAGIAVQQRSLSSGELQEAMLTGACLVIALVDKRKLDPCTTLDACMGLPTLCGIDVGYTGHYILIIGYDAVQQQFIVRDPATMVSELRVSAVALDAARRSFGTDEDLIIVPCSFAPPPGDSSALGVQAEWLLESIKAAAVAGPAAAGSS